MPGSERDVVEPPAAPQPRRFDEDGDATRRTWLASERTVLAWLRTGLTSTAVAVAIGRILPELTHGERTWPFVALGLGYALLGVVIVAYGLQRGREVDRAIRAGRWISPDDRAMWLVGALTILLGLGSIAVVLM